MAATNTRDGSFASDLRALLQSGKGADVTLVVGASELPAHSCILAARSPVFAAMLQNNMKEAHSRRVEITDVQEAVLRQLLCFMYTDTAPQVMSMAAELLAAADKYDLPLLKKLCEEKMVEGLSVDNAAATAVLAVLHTCPGLKCATVDFIASHPEVMISDGWLNVLRSNTEAAAHICSLAVAATAESTQTTRSLSVEQTQDLAEQLTVAAKTANVDELQRLLTAGAPVDARNGSGFTALHMAVMKAGKGTTSQCWYTGPETVKCLLQAGANVNAQDSSLQTPLHAAAHRGNVKIMWELLLASAQVDAQDRWGKTPLHWAVAARKIEAIRLLLIAGADTSIEDHKHKTPEYLATDFIKDLFYKYQ